MRQEIYLDVAVLRIVERVNVNTIAAKYDVSPRTVQKWVARAMRGDGTHEEFLRSPEARDAFYVDVAMLVYHRRVSVAKVAAHHRVTTRAVKNWLARALKGTSVRSEYLRSLRAKPGTTADAIPDED